MKRRNLIRHLLNNDCVLLREGAGHSIYVNAETGNQAQFRAIVKSRSTLRSWCVNS